jgi:hypothetical protein
MPCSSATRFALTTIDLFVLTRNDRGRCLSNAGIKIRKEMPSRVADAEGVTDWEEQPVSEPTEGGLHLQGLI